MIISGSSTALFNKLFVAVVIFALSFPVAGSVFAQNGEPQTKKRPTIGLVLSGGGARGFAHVGVLKVLEENRIPVDYIAGASMGALVGSLYAAGKTPAELETLVETLDWEKLLSGAPAYDELTYRRKQDRRNLPGGVTLGGRDLKSLKLPSSINPGHEIGLVIDRLMLPYSTVDDFDNFPIPFRCVATDMVNAETVVLKGGSIQQALRATMAIPAIFAPVEVNGKILADGGILNNIPTDVAKAMGADIILVVNIETQIGDRSALLDLIGVLGQTLTVATIENSRRSLRQADIIIAPDLGTYSTGSFGSGSEIVKLGYEGAKTKASILKSLSMTEEEWKEHLAARRARVAPVRDLTPEFLAVTGTNGKRQSEIINETLEPKYVGQELVEKQIEADLTRLTGTRRFDSLGYEITVDDGKRGLLIRNYDTKERSERRSVLEAGFEVNNTDSDSTNFNARARLTFFDIGKFGSEWRNDLSIGSTMMVSSEYFRPIGESKFFVAPNALYRNRDVDFFVDGTRTAEYGFESALAGVDLGYTFNRRTEARLGYKLGYQRATRRVGDPLIENLGGRYSAAVLGFEHDGANDGQIPTRGIRGNASLSYFFNAPGATGDFAQGEANYSVMIPVSEKYTFFNFGSGGTTFGKTAPPLQQFTLGGLFSVGGYGREEFRGSSVLRGGAGFLRETYSMPAFIGGKIYLGGWYEGGSVFEGFSESRYRQSATGGVLMETPLGPIFVGGSLSGSGRGKVYFSLGRFF
ncbi:MAG: patatin-like phospholipase family protein [Pyrinomonadaceae bacterium]|nr:patatin-like phospholipase family protein [Pyrinomonadaceae bacterium]